MILGFCDRKAGDRRGLAGASRRRSSMARTAARGRLGGNWPPWVSQVKQTGPAPSFLAKRVQIAHEALEPLGKHVRVNLRCRYIGMAEQGLDRAEVRAVLQEVARKGVAQHVRAQPLGTQPGGGSEHLEL